MRKTPNPPPPKGGKPDPPVSPSFDGDDGGNVILFEPGLEMTPRTKMKPMCKHMKVLVDEQSRMIECRSCNAVIDPFDFLWRWANKRLRFHRTVAHLSDERKELTKMIDELKRQERNAKGRLKRAEGKLGQKWVRLSRKSRDGEYLFVCRYCGGIRSSPDELLPIGQCSWSGKQTQCNL